MADALARMKSASSQQSLAESMMTPEYAANSGALGSLAMIAQAYAGKKRSEKATKEDAAAREAYYKGQSAAEQEKARREAEKDAAERERRQGVARQMGLSAREALEFAETGKVPQAVRNVPMMTDQGLVNVNPYTGEYAPVQPQGQSNVRIDPALANNPEAMAAIQQDMAVGAPAGDQSYQVQQQRPLMPYRDPAEAQRQAAADARANAQLGLAYRAAERADAAETRAQQAARVAQEKAQREAGSRNLVLDQWEAARQGLEEGLGASETGPIVGRIPAFTTEQQVAEGAVAATAPILKQLFRTAGEGTFTDKDQELLLRMVPTRTDTPEARATKIANIDRIIRAKVGVQQPSGGGIDDLLKKYGGK